MTKKLQSHWRRKLMKFWITHFRSRFALCSLWSVIFLRLSYVFLLTPQNLHRLLFSNPLGWTVNYYSQKDINTIPYAKFAGQTQWIMGIRKKSVGKRCVRTRRTSSSLFSSTEPWNFFGLAQTRVLESKMPPTNVLASERRTLIKRVQLFRVFFYPSLLQNLLSLFDSHTKH